MGSKPDDLDALLRAAMEDYIPEPRAGIEQRVVYRVRARGRRLFWFPAYAVSCSVLALIVLFFVTRPARVGEPSVLKRAPELTVVVAPPVPEAPVLKRRQHRRVVEVKPFPTPTPLTDEEKALQAFAATQTHDAQELLVWGDEKPIEIPELQIPPLQSDGGQ